MKKSLRFVAIPLAAAAMALATTAVAPAAAETAKSPAAAETCYGSAVGYTAIGTGFDTAEWPYGDWKYTTKNCGDINIKTNYSRWVRVCWKYIPCDDWVPAYAGKWTVVNTHRDSIPDGWGFYLEFQGGNNSTGAVAF
ncbi:hypothetical protein ACFQVC_32895 [Streptomyces monticola]|uniref:Peptidase inhibitor family I36 protein n=1 Tax=Streptomyces monticola TaxID=2666263 RepID=A0ABW2JUI7_9ACTN